MTFCFYKFKKKCIYLELFFYKFYLIIFYIYNINLPVLPYINFFKFRTIQKHTETISIFLSKLERANSIKFEQS